MQNIFETFPTASFQERESLHQEFRKALNARVATDPVGTILALQHEYDPTWNFSLQQQYYKVFDKARKQFGGEILPGFKPLKIAAVGSTTLTQLLWLLELNLLASGWLTQTYEANYGVFRQELLDNSSDLYAFGPQLLFVLTGHRDTFTHPETSWSGAETQNRVEQEFASWLRLWETFNQKTGNTIIQNNFDVPDTRLFGNLELRVPGSEGRFLQQLNLHMAANLPEYVLLHDLDYLSAYHGKKHFNDPRFYHHSKQQCSFDVLPDYAANLGAIVRAQRGMIRKCLVLDLDNTLWGGVIGDDGINGIQIGEGVPSGEAYLSLQRYAKSLKDRGILLAVCSKNDETIAREPFQSHPDMALRLDDIACFVANWNPKPDNIRQIAQTLNIGIDSLVFVDDNPAERAIVRQMLPEVAVPELPDDPAMYSRVLSEGRYFESVTFNDEDRLRTRFYLDNQKRDEFAQAATNLDDFLSKLGMIATICPFTEVDLDRITQLVARSNQFNLTTRRYTHADLQGFMNDPQYVTRSIRLTDTFGDNGLISVWIGKHEGDTLLVDTWLMSCRVLSRGVEQHLRNHIVSYAREHGLHTIRGAYIPTKKNKLVEEHYAKLGFVLTRTHDDGTTEWELLVDKQTPILPTYIKDA